ncbi:MAG: single-stranded-DNA-specific exonuclease RecJ [Chitinivibrionales bacterium]|nr:single-stranded-DNA-specific exonuclease RecJ [Chitinivibrionales bacterium]
MPLAAVLEKVIVRVTDPDKVAKLAGELGVAQPIASILVARGLDTFNRCKAFFRPQLELLHDPFLFDDMEKACERILFAIKEKQRIIVYGDYDVDGVTSTALLIRMLRRMGAECDYYLPNRLTEGYGFSQDSVAEIISGAARLIISVDCGISALSEIEQATAAGIDVIVTDHHEPPEKIPAAYALINPKLPECAYPDKFLAGVGVTLKLCQALARKSELPDEFWMEYLDLAAIGTAADIVPLIGENRIIARFGFEKLLQTSSPGLQALMQLQRLEGMSISTSRVVFQLAPCINAVGRLGDPRRGVELLLTEDRALARLYARELQQANEERKALDKRVQTETFAWVKQHCHTEHDFAIVAGSASWHVGVIGIVASKLVETFFRPTVLFSFDADGMARGSGRSIPALNLFEALKECEDLFESFGGHAAAAGMVMKRENLETFRRRFNNVARERMAPADLIPIVKADTEVDLRDLSPKFLRILKQMEPFGPGNMRPVLYCRNLANRYKPRIVGNGHVKMAVTDGAAVMDAIGFNFGNRFEEVRDAQTFNLAFGLDENEWMGRKSLQMNIKGIST